MPDQDPMKTVVPIDPNMFKGPMEKPVSIDLDITKPAKKISAWQKLQDSAKDIEFPRQTRPPTTWMNDPVKMLDTSISSTKAGKAVKDWVATDPLSKPTMLPDFPPAPELKSDGSMLGNFQAAAQGIVDKTTRKIYQKVIQPLASGQNLAIMGGMALAPEAAVPYLGAMLSAPMIAQGYKGAIEAGKETDPATRHERYLDAGIDLAMGLLAGTHSGTKLIKEVGEVPVIKAITEHVKNSKLIQDESGQITQDFLLSTEKFSNKEPNHISWVKLPNGKVSIMTSDKSGKIIYNEEIPLKALKDVVGVKNASDIILSELKYGDAVPEKKATLPTPPPTDWVKYGKEAVDAAKQGEALHPLPVVPSANDAPHVSQGLPDGVVYNGVQENPFGPDMHMYTDKGNTGTTFVVEPGQSIVDKLAEKQKQFGGKSKAESNPYATKPQSFGVGGTETLPPPPAPTKIGKLVKSDSFYDYYEGPDGKLTAVMQDTGETTKSPFEPKENPKPISNAEFDPNKHALVYLEDGEWKQMKSIPYPIQNMKGELKSAGIEHHVVPIDEIENGKWVGGIADSANDINWGYVKTGPDSWTISTVSDAGGANVIGSMSKKEMIANLPPHVSKVILTNDVPGLSQGHGLVTKEMIQSGFDKEAPGSTDTITEIDPANYDPKTDTVVYKSKVPSWGDEFYDFYPTETQHIDDITKWLQDNGNEFKIVPKSSLKEGKWKPPVESTPVDPVTHFDKTTNVSQHNIGGIPFKSVDTVLTPGGDYHDSLWHNIKGTVPNEPPMPNLPAGKAQSAGSIIMEDDGRVWIVEPKNHYGGYEHTFPKGRVEGDYNPVETAVKEGYEESGLKAQPHEYLGDFEGDTTNTRYYISRRVSGSPIDFGNETQSVKLVTLDEAKKLLNKPRDQQIIDKLIERYGNKKSGMSAPPSIDLGTLDLDASKMSKVGGKEGSNPGGWYKSPTGEKYYIKEPRSTDHAKNEVLGAKLYRLAGIDVADVNLAKTENGKLGVASREITGLKQGKSADLAAAQGAKEGLAVDAWLGNWDVVGLANDNMLIDKSGKAIRLDTGGSLRYRAQGAEKGHAFGSDAIGDLRGLRRNMTNSEAAAVFGKMTDKEIVSSIDQLKHISDDDVNALVKEYGPDGEANKKALFDKLIQRKDSLISHGVMMGANTQYDGIFKTKAPMTTLKTLTPRDAVSPITPESNLHIMSYTPTFADSFQEPHRSGLEHYKSAGFDGINNIARFKIPEDQASPSARTNHKLMREIFDRLNENDWHGTLHRGVPSSIMGKLEVGKIYEDPGFASWSTSQTFAHNWGNDECVLKLEVNGKNKILNVGKALDEVDSEYENILYGKNMRIIRIQDVPKLDCDGKLSPYKTIREYWGVIE